MTPLNSGTPMIQRPRSVTFFSCLCLAAGMVSLAYHATEFMVADLFQFELIALVFVPLLAIVGGAFALCGANRGRWLLVVWIAYHVIISLWHSRLEFTLHALLLIVMAHVFFRTSASAYFRREGAAGT